MLQARTPFFGNKLYPRTTVQSPLPLPRNSSQYCHLEDKIWVRGTSKFWKFRWVSNKVLEKVGVFAADEKRRRRPDATMVANHSTAAAVAADLRSRFLAAAKPLTFFKFFGETLTNFWKFRGTPNPYVKIYEILILKESCLSNPNTWHKTARYTKRGVFILAKKSVFVFVKIVGGKKISTKVILYAQEL